MSETRPYYGPVEALTMEQWLEARLPATPDPTIPEDWQGQWIYLIASPSDLVKVGISRDPDARLAGLQSGHHDGLRLLATVAGLKEDEGALHRLLRAHRVRGEWFKVGPWLDAFMAGAHAGENAGMILKRLEVIAP